MENARKMLWAILFGQVIQTFTFILADQINAKHPAAFAIFSGLFLTSIVVAGMAVMGREMSEEDNKHRAEKERKALVSTVESLKSENSKLNHSQKLFTKYILTVNPNFFQSGCDSLEEFVEAKMTKGDKSK